MNDKKLMIVASVLMGFGLAFDVFAVSAFGIILYTLSIAFHK